MFRETNVKNTHEKNPSWITTVIKVSCKKCDWAKQPYTW